MEFKRDERDGIFKLMEINCRANKTGSLDVYCGINFPWIQYKHLVLGEIEKQGNRVFKENVYWIDSAKDMVMFFTSRKEEEYALKDYVKPYLGEKVFAIFSWKDPIPFIKRFFNIGRTAVGDLFSGIIGKKKVESQNKIIGRDEEYLDYVFRENR